MAIGLSSSQPFPFSLNIDTLDECRVEQCVTFMLDSLVIVYGLIFSLFEMQTRVVPKLTEILRAQDLSALNLQFRFDLKWLKLYWASNISFSIEIIDINMKRRLIQRSNCSVIKRK